ncbi:AsmA family protein [Dichotomicrobium thermohalophilum]|uniref:Uncharacterized protein involved in outer membrane biogenesis n=1 Tax=Dichotomicrobium thermohalophilum TaxID=933063 RepID=A0A397Q793_9HYPH|nr:AsmA family protein [Dichotomicrobium thermohalophilum]RIA55675.1 uncharacterized protein involved in outer membrane biogenesis [Dichotomicrobium thermohalophilum]
MSLFRRVIAGLALVLALLLLVAAAAPYLVDGRTVRDQLVTKLSGWAEGDLRVKGDVRLTSLFDLTIEAEDARIEAPSRFPRVAEIRVDQVAARLNLWALLNGRIVFAKVWVDRPVISLRDPLAEATPAQLWRTVLLDEGEAVAHLAAAVRDAPFEYIELTDARVNWASSADQAAPWSVVISRESGADTVVARGEAYGDSDPLRFTLERGPFRPAGPTLEAPLRLVTESEGWGRLAVDGRIIRANGARFLGNIDVQNAPLSLLADWLGLPAGDALTDGRYTATAALEATAGKISLQQLDLEVGETRATGLLNLQVDGETPTLSGTLGLSSVDLRGLSLSGQSDGILVAEDPRNLRHGGLSSHAQRIGAWLERFDADLRLSAESLQFDGLSTGETAAFLSVSDGVATLDVAELLIFEGMMNGQFSVRWADRAFLLNGKGKAAGIDLERVLSSAQLPPLATGAADISFSVDGAGSTLAAAARNVQVGGRLMALQGGELALDVGAMASQARQRSLNGEGARAGMQMTAERANFEMLRASFLLKDRELRLAPVVLAQNGWIVRGRGRAELTQQRLDWRLDAARMPPDGDQAQAGLAERNNASAADKDAISLHVTGTLQRPWVSYTMPELPLSSAGSNSSWWP